MTGDKVVAIRDVAELIRGVSYRPTDLLSSGASEALPLLRATNIGAGHLELSSVLLVPPSLAKPEQLLCPFDIVIAMSSGSKAAVGRLAQLRQAWRGCVGAFCAVIRPKADRIDPQFLGYVLQSPEFRQRIESHAEGTAIMNLSRDHILGFEFEIPARETQRAIAQILGALDDKIELNRRMAQTLDEMARALFKSWFVDFDPVRAKAEGRGPGLPKHLADLFPDRLVDSDLGEIPEGWTTATLGDLCKTQYGFTASATDEAVGPKFLRVTDINKRNWIDWSEVPYCEADEGVRSRYGLRVGDVLVARMADPGKSAIVEEDVDAVFASYLVRLTPATLADSYFIFSFLKSDLYGEYAAATRSGSVQANMNARVIVGANLAVPPEPLRSAFLSYVLPLRQRLCQCIRQVEALRDARDALLPKLVSGTVRLSDPEGLLARLEAVT